MDYLNKEKKNIYIFNNVEEWNSLPSSDKHSSAVSFEIQRISSNLRILLKFKNNLWIGNGSRSH